MLMQLLKNRGSQKTSDKAIDYTELNLQFAGCQYKRAKVIELSLSFKALLKKNPDAARLHYLIGCCLYEALALQEAQTYWNNAYELEPDNRQYQCSLFYLNHLLQTDNPKQLSEQIHDLPVSPIITVDRLFNLPIILNHFGFVIVKNLINKEAINEIKNNIIENVNLIKGKCAIDHENCILPLYFIANHADKNSFAEKFVNAYPSGRHFVGESYDTEERNTINHFARQLLSPSFSLAVENLLGKKNWQLHHDYSMARVTGLHGYDSAGFAPLHQDSRIQNRFDPNLVLWIPLVETKDTASICAVTTHFSDYFPYLVIPGGNYMNYRSFPDPLIYQAIMEPGDVWIHNGLTVHGTYIPKEVKNTRYSIDMRLF